MLELNEDLHSFLFVKLNKNSLNIEEFNHNIKFNSIWKRKIFSRFVLGRYDYLCLVRASSLLELNDNVLRTENEINEIDELVTIPCHRVALVSCFLRQH